MINSIVKTNGILDTDKLKKLPPNLYNTLNEENVEKIFTNPNKITSRQEGFDLGQIDLKPGKKVIVLLSQDDKKILNSIQLGHRKREEFWNLKKGESNKSYDEDGAYSEIKVFDSISQTWKSWIDPKGYNPIKYAERRYDIEYENLHDWIGTVGKIDPIAIEIKSVGKNPNLSIVTLYSLDVFTSPNVDDKTEIKEKIYSKGTSFVDFNSNGNKIPNYGGGKNKGHYNNAVPLGGRNHKEHFPLTTNLDSNTEYLDEKNNLHIKLPPNKKILSIEVAIGDTWFNYKSDGSLQLGWSKLYANLVKANGEIDNFLSNINIPPEGVLLGGIKDKDYITCNGDEIVLKSTPTSYLMGWRILFEDMNGEISIKNEISKTTQDVQNTIKEITSMDELEIISKKAGGTQGGNWYEHKITKEKYFVKKHNGNFDRCATEYISSQFYQKMEIPIINSQIVGNMVFSKEIPGELFSGNKYNEEFIKNYFNKNDILKGFVVDAWLANWDVFGLDYDNILKTQNDTMVRVDCGGCMFFRGMGSYKPSFANSEVSEIETMRDTNLAREAGIIFQNITQNEIIKQVQKLKQVITDKVIEETVKNSGISNSKNIINILKNRRDWLIGEYL